MAKPSVRPTPNYSCTLGGPLFLLVPTFLVLFFAAVLSRSEDYRERCSASGNAVERAPAFRLHPANGLRSSSVRLPSGFSRLLRRAAQFHSHGRRAHPLAPFPLHKIKKTTFPNSFRFQRLLTVDPKKDRIECITGARWSPPQSHLRRDDPSWRDEASPRYAVVAVAPWPIGLRGCCIIYSPKQREEESERRIEQR